MGNTVKNIMNPLRKLNTSMTIFFLAFGLSCVGLSHAARAVSPPPDGGYPNDNTAEGDRALFSLVTGRDNTALGFDALSSVTTGTENTATGSEALKNNTGNRNTADGYRALFKNTGSDNTAVGFAALEQNTSAINNVAIGSDALGGDVTGFQNVAVGAGALTEATTGSRNIGIGFLAGQSVVAGNDNIYIGNIGGGRHGGIDFSGSIRIGTQGTQTLTRIAGIFGATVFNGAQVYIDSSGQLATTPSSVRFKEEIAPMNKASETLYALKPVTFRYHNEIDPTRTRQLGLVAEDVEKINPDLVVRDTDGKPYSVRYDQVNAMLLNEFLKEHRTVQGQQKEIDALKAELTEQKTLIQKVSAQVEASKPAPQVVNNNQ